MVRAAVSGAINYATADPYNKQWRIKHVLVLQEVARLADEKIIQAVQRHWLAYVSHSGLESDSWSRVKDRATEALKGIQSTLFPWVSPEETAAKKDTIESKYGHLIAQYRALVARKTKENNTENAGN